MHTVVSKESTMFVELISPQKCFEELFYGPHKGYDRVKCTSISSLNSRSISILNCVNLSGHTTPPEDRRGGRNIWTGSRINLHLQYTTSL